jgi:hypothetical protein
MAKNICNCPNPPGGIVECESRQIAICQVKDGIIISKCINPLIKPKRFGELKIADNEVNPLAYRITGDSSFLVEKNSLRARHMLSRGVYINNESGEVTTFNLPTVWDVDFDN